MCGPGLLYPIHLTTGEAKQFGEHFSEKIPFIIRIEI